MTRERKVTMAVALPPDLVALIEADRFGDTVSVVIRERLAQAFKMGPREATPRSRMDDLDLRKKAAEAEMAEQRAATMRGEYTRIDLAKVAIQKDYANIKSHITQIPFRILNLTPEQMADAEAAVQDCLTDLSCTKPATWDDLADETAKEFI